MDGRWVAIHQTRVYTILYNGQVTHRQGVSLESWKKTSAILCKIRQNNTDRFVQPPLVWLNYDGLIWSARCWCDVFIIILKNRKIFGRAGRIRFRSLRPMISCNTDLWLIHTCHVNIKRNIYKQVDFWSANTHYLYQVVCTWLRELSSLKDNNEILHASQVILHLKACYNLSIFSYKI